MKMRIILGLLVVGGLSIYLSSCKDDEVPKSGVSFELAEEFVNESNGAIDSFHPLLFDGATGRTIVVKIILDRPLQQTAVIAYSIGGTATKNSTTEPVGDFEIVGNNENITIQKGETEASITIKLYEDYDFEVEDEDEDGFFETIELTLESVVSGTAVISEENKYVLTVYEDDTVIFLDWDAGAGTTGDVDMDLIVWLDSELLGASDRPGNDPEGIALPAGFPNGTYGFGYTYYSGTSDNLKFTVDIINLGGTLNNANLPLSYTGNYKLVNINKYDDDTDPNYKGEPLQIQTMVKNGFNYANVTGLTIPSSGSRAIPPTSNLKNRLKSVNEINNLRSKE